jgi:hypothetical protein
LLDKAQFDDVADGIGLSVGATALRAVAIGRSAVTRSPVLTLYPHRLSEVGVPSENPNLAERGLIITDFVDRVGDPVAIVAADGSSHRAEVLLADALRALLLTVTGGRPPAEPVGVTYPAHWSPTGVEALRRALAALPEFVDAPLMSDALTALTALQDEPGLPTRGIVALCDVGGSGANISLADAANGFQPIGPTIRHPDLSGDLIDQALLARVVGDLGKAGAIDLSSTSAIGSLGRLRGQCRAAKERLSTSAVTSMAVDLPGNRTEVRITRTELDDAIRVPLTGFVELLQDTLQRSGIRPNDLVAVASVGGGARLPILTTTLSEHLRVPVVTSAQPELAAAIGGGLKAVRGLVPDGVTSMAPAAAAIVPAAMAGADAPGSSTFRALAWSDADELPDPIPADPALADYQPDYEPYDPRPQMAFADHDEDDAVAAPLPWYRQPVGMVAIGLLAVAALITAAAVYVLRNDESPATTPSSGVTTTAPPTTDAPASEAPPPESQVPEQQQAPAQRTVTQQAPPPVVTVTDPPPPVTEAPPPPPTTTEPPPPTTEAPTTQTTQPPSSTQAPLIPTLPYQTIPGLPFVPAPIQPAQP